MGKHGFHRCLVKSENVPLQKAHLNEGNTRLYRHQHSYVTNVYFTRFTEYLILFPCSRARTF